MANKRLCGVRLEARRSGPLAPDWHTHLRPSAGPEPERLAEAEEGPDAGPGPVRRSSTGARALDRARPRSRPPGGPGRRQPEEEPWKPPPPPRRLSSGTPGNLARLQPGRVTPPPGRPGCSLGRLRSEPRRRQSRDVSLPHPHRGRIAARGSARLTCCSEPSSPKRTRIARFVVRGEKWSCKV